MRALVVAAGLGSSLVLGPTSIWSQTIDSQSLVGAWEGTWPPRVGEAGVGGQYYLTIDRVDGNKVYGSGHVTGRRTADFKFVGTLDGNRLTYGTATRTELELVTPTRMQGNATGNFNSAITLRKKN
jgi:hypothetical protein